MDDEYSIEDIDLSVKVGKSSLALRYIENQFTTEYKKTIGVDFLKKKKFIKSIDKEINFHIWDTAGQEYFDSLTKKYYRGADIAIFVFSVSDRNSFLSIKSWKDKVIDVCGDKIPMLLIMNKIDISEDEKKVDIDEAINLSKGVNMNLYRVSVKENLKIEEIFEDAANLYMKQGLNKNTNKIITDVAEVSNKNKIKLDSNQIKEIEENKKKPVLTNVDSNNKNVTTDVAFKIEKKVVLDKNGKNTKKKGKCC